MKHVIIINGSGGVGKDTLIKYAQKYFKICNASSIDPIKKIARAGGWSVKDEKGRKLLVDLKNLFIAFNDLPTNYLMGKYNKFLASQQNFMFAHIREPQEIKKFKSLTNAKTLLVTRQDVSKTLCMHDEAEFKYDFTFKNDGNNILESGERFVELLRSL